MWAEAELTLSQVIARQSRPWWLVKKNASSNDSRSNDSVKYVPVCKTTQIRYPPLQAYLLNHSLPVVHQTLSVAISAHLRGLIHCNHGINGSVSGSGIAKI